MLFALLLCAVMTMGLYAGFMLTFLIAVMPGLAVLSDERFTDAMRRFNEKVPGPLFLLLFVGTVAFPATALLVAPTAPTSSPLILGALCCAVVSHLITIVGNIPLNKALADAEGGDDAAARVAFEARWNRLHAARAVISLAGFASLSAAVV
jgi:uncharacterized membrane protein